ncbi:uncharacterized protein LOC119602340 isoform X1 [Lucilia sericata]|uniref:uncharacterized protein LOC119602340 isoform X1 n=1 Tax=Lucilia sericata TaxID=13632 RepID=UPI0018A8034B|nr:uncharacterized protein LOC119602340 isoform X1 [Lucilia sericata]XP_037809717.1 uncharacterized protein LOC119602340 isoform X1 [Lucilia sericata]XP_037809718.1 uncharacterized protein LOC119602340 isoform X1 [Lucilia sericata]XP_037809719.1 uncharacterized protein LOC119602340 isoform X1 [Lucilia sericata]XP_037809720.1 uncharacterized protein LOC119602340 isoform X1 [Lucilia sericata]XP_037809721.1 uncharacterized protein LOC119602340 isoform X1 [Lucilia sericata]XP_037809722.1 uncharac
MIGSFWNLCRACPSMPVDKQLHSEYRSTYRWHEFTGNSRPEVVRRAPAPNPSQFVGPTNEPPLPRRKKCPELAYKSHEFIIGSEYTDARNNAANRMARSEERNGTPSRRSKSEGPPAVPNGRAYAIPTEVDGPETKQAGESNNGLFKKTISKLSTEYRLQFVWPNVRRIRDQTGSNVHKTTAKEQQQQQQQPKKSISLGAIRGQQHHPLNDRCTAAMPTVHKKRTTNQKEATLHELEPLVSDAEDRKPIEKQVTIQEKKVTTRPFSQLIDQERANHFITKKENFGFADATEADNKQQHAKLQEQQQQGEIIMNGSAPPYSKPNLDLWFKEVVEMRKKAGEYKSRGWGKEIDPELYKKQQELWDQVSKRSSLSSLCLASTMPRPITKEEKDEENNKKTAPILKTYKPRVPGQAYFLENLTKDELNALPARFSHIRHHLERTTGPDVEEGALLPSPTREKLMPAITKRESESQRGSPKKTAASRHGSPQKGSPQKGSPKKVLKIRSQSVGPEHESPKRQLRSASTAPYNRTAGKKTPTTATQGTTERKPRPSTLSTTFHSRTKSSSLPPPSGRAHANAAATASHPAANANQMHLSTSQSNKSPQPPQMRKSDKDKTNAAKPRSKTSTAKSSSYPPHPPPSDDMTSSKILVNGHDAHKDVDVVDDNDNDKIIIAGKKANLLALDHLAVPGRDKKLVENDTEDGRDTAISVSSCSPQPVAEVPEEPIVKSPPEPTRVKSPEQIIMRSPDPVNWTVPLDTGKTFTVTQNVKEGENYSRPQSEIKASTPVEKPPPPPQSAPPELTEQVKMDAAWKTKQPRSNNAHNNNNNNEAKSPTQTTNNTSGSPTTEVGKNTLLQNNANRKPVPGTTIRVLEDPMFDVDVILASSAAAGGQQQQQQQAANLSSSSNSTTTTASTARTTATDVLEKARDRFDRFWGGNTSKEESV